VFPPGFALIDAVMQAIFGFAAARLSKWESAPMNPVPPDTTLSMRELRAMSSAPRRENRIKTAPQVEDAASGQMPVAPELLIPKHLRPWLKEAALKADVSASAATGFSSSGLLMLGTTQVLMFSREIGPATEWWLQGYIQRPETIAPHLWSEVLLWGNSVAPGLEHCAFAINEQGRAMLSLRMPFYQEGDVVTLSEALGQMDCLSNSLALGLLHQPSLEHSGTPESIEGAPEVSADSRAFQAHIQQRSDQAAAEALAVKWHQPLVDQMLEVLDIPRVKGQVLRSASVFRLMGSEVEMIADGDGRNLLISTLLKRPLRTAAQQIEALQMNVHLMSLAGACIALDPQGSRLLSRWDSTALDGQALADSLVSFVMLAATLSSTESPGQNVPASTAARSFS
jgi:hypothetical protein